MTPHQIRVKAEEFNLDYRLAVKMRLRYLHAQMVKGIDWMLEEADMPDVMFDDCIEQITRLYASLKQRPDTSITDDMISQAKAVRIDSILEFRRGKCHCIAPDHQDKNPSAYYGSRANVLVCPVCDRKWDAIAVQMHFTGQTFKQAVRELCG